MLDLGLLLAVVARLRWSSVCKLRQFSCSGRGLPRPHFAVNPGPVAAPYQTNGGGQQHAGRGQADDGPHRMDVHRAASTDGGALDGALDAADPQHQQAEGHDATAPTAAPTTTMPAARSGWRVAMVVSTAAPTENAARPPRPRS